MGGLFAYSGLSTKIKAMQAKLFTDAQYEEIAALKNVMEVVEYLKKYPAYRAIFAGTEGELHRGKIEELFQQAIYQDFQKIYSFANMEQRKYLDLYFMHYEILFLKHCLRLLFDKKKINMDITRYEVLFANKSKLNIKELVSAESLDDFIARLKGASYYDVLNKIGDTGKRTLYDYEMALDLFFFQTFSKAERKFSKGNDKKALSEIYGKEMDILNIQWIYRAKKYYAITQADIYAMLIPVHYRLKKPVILKMVEAASAAEVMEVVKETYYGDYFKESAEVSVEKLYRRALNHFHNSAVRRYPYSIACMDTYLYKKEQEIDRLTTALECIRYDLEVGEIKDYVII